MAAATVGPGSTAHVQSLMLRLFKSWWERLGCGAHRAAGTPPPCIEVCIAAIRALMTGSCQYNTPPVTSSIPQHVFSDLCRSEGLPRGMTLVFATLAAAGCHSQSSSQQEPGCEGQCSFAKGSVPRLAGSTELLCELREHANLTRALLDALVTLTAQRQGLCACAADLLRAFVDLSASRLQRAPLLDVDVPGWAACQMVQVARSGARAAYLACAEFQKPHHRGIVRWCGNVGFASNCVSLDGSTHTGGYFHVRGVGKVKLTVQCAILQPGDENAVAFEAAAHRWVHSSGPGECKRFRAEHAWVGRMDREWENKGWGWQNLGGTRTPVRADFWQRLGYNEAPGEKFVCAWLCEADGQAQLP